MEETLAFRFVGGSVASTSRFLPSIGWLLHQIITARGTEIYSMKATSALDLETFTNDLELNITTVSSMTCSQLRGLSTMTTGSPGFIDYSAAPLSTFTNYSCHNSTEGPIIVFKCHSCPLNYEHMYISWHFVDIENVPATTVGFSFNFTVKNRADHKLEYVNYVSGTLKNGSSSDDSHITYRGATTSLLKFHLFPRVYLNLRGLKLLQPLFHEFRPGSHARSADNLRSLLQSSANGVVNTTLELKFLSDYFVEIDDKKYAGKVTFLADVGGLYCLSFTVFLLLLSLCESRIKTLRTEDQIMQNINNRRKAEDRWDKLRRYVAYTYSCNLLDEKYNKNTQSTCCIQGNGALKRFRQREILLQSFSNRTQPWANSEKVLKDVQGFNEATEVKHSFAAYNHDPHQPSKTNGSEANAIQLQKELHNLYELNAMLFDQLTDAQTRLGALCSDQVR